MHKAHRLLVLLCTLLLLSGCAARNMGTGTVSVVFEDNAEIGFITQRYQVTRGEDLTARLTLPEGTWIADVSYEHWSADAVPDSDQVLLTLYGVRYPSLIRITLQTAYTTCVHLTADAPHAPYTETSTRLRPNAPAWSDDDRIDGRVAIGWNTQPDGSGTHVGFGSRPERTAEPLELYLETVPASPEECFSWREENGGAVITRCDLTEDVTVPETLNGLPVTGIAAGAFGRVTGTLVLPSSLTFIEEGAFVSL